MDAYTVDALPFPLPKLVLGTFALGSLPDRAVDELLETWVDAGGTMIDTARIYGGGSSERVLGRWAERTGSRKGLLLSTKGCHFDDQRDRLTKADLDEDIARSLDALRTDYLDVYLLHRDDPDVPVDEVIDWLDEYRRAGVIRSAGASNWTIDRVARAQSYALSSGRRGFSCVSNYFGLAAASEPLWRGCVMTSEQDLRWFRNTQMPNLAWAAQSRGFFGGRFRPVDRWLSRVPGARRLRRLPSGSADVFRVFYSDLNWGRFARARQLGAKRGFSAVQVACAYVISQEFPSAALVGPQSKEELLNSISALDLQLSRGEVEWLEGGRTPDPRGGE